MSSHCTGPVVLQSTDGRVDFQFTDTLRIPSKSLGNKVSIKRICSLVKLSDHWIVKFEFFFFFLRMDNNPFL